MYPRIPLKYEKVYEVGREKKGKNRLLYIHIDYMENKKIKKKVICCFRVQQTCFVHLYY